MNFNQLEPLMSFRFSIEFPGVDIPEYLFSKYKLYTEGEDFVFETYIYDTVSFQINPVNILNISQVNVNHLDPTGFLCGGYSFKIKGIYYETEGDYSKDNLLTHKIKGVIEEKTFKLIYNHNNNN